MVSENPTITPTTSNQQAQSTIIPEKYQRYLVIASLIVLFVMWLFIFLRGYDHGLPFVERKDEGRNLAEVYIQRGLFPIQPNKPGYPPGIIWVYSLSQYATEIETGRSAHEAPGHVMLYVRLGSAFANLFTASMIWLSTQKLTRNYLAAFLAAFAWLSFPLISESTVAGLPQVYEISFLMLSLYFALLALEHENPRYAIFSTAAGLMTVIFKYTDLTVLGLGVGATLWFMRHDWKRWGKTLGLQFLMIVLVAYFLFFIYGATGLIEEGHAETRTFMEGGIFRILEVGRGLNILNGAIDQIALTAPVYVIVVALGSFLFWRKANTWRRVGFLYAAILAFSGLWFITTFQKYDRLIRQTVPFSGLVVMFMVISLVFIANWIAERIRQPLVMPILVGVFAVGWLYAPLQEHIEISNRRILPGTVAAFMQWSADALDGGAMILSNEIDHVFAGEWSGYTGPLRAAILRRTLQDESLETWREMHVHYVQMTATEYHRLQQSESGQAYLDQMLFLKEFPPEGERDQWRGLDMVVLRLWDMEHEVNFAFGDQIMLRGYDLSATEASAGDSISVTPYWQAIQQPTANYNVFLHFTPLDDPAPLAQADASPASINRLTSTWTDTGETYWGTELTITLPEDIEAGAYRLKIGLYDFNTGVRLIGENGDDFFEIGEIEVGE